MGGVLIFRTNQTYKTIECDLKQERNDYHTHNMAYFVNTTSCLNGRDVMALIDTRASVSVTSFEG